MPGDYLVDGVKNLGRWILLQRERYFRRGRYIHAQPMPEEEIRALEEIGMVWGGTNAYKWDIMYEAVRRYILETGCLPTARCPETGPNGQSIGCWVSQQRRACKQGKLEPCRAEKLRELGIIRDWMGRGAGKTAQPAAGRPRRRESTERLRARRAAPASAEKDF